MSPLNAPATLGDEFDAATPESPASSSSSSPSLDTPAPASAAATAASKRTAAAAQDPGLKRNGQPKKKKIRTYSRRKEEMAQLQVELEELEGKRQRVSELAEEALKRRALRDCEEHNRRLREAIHTQRLLLANTTSIISEFMRVQDYNPFETFIRLGRDPVARRAAMLAIKPRKIQDAVQFLRENRRFMDPTTEFCEAKRFRARNGDVCSIRFEIAPFPGVTSVKRAFDTLQHFVHNMEINISEVMGDITVRENDDDDFDDSMTQHRLVTSVSNVVFLDTNNVTFAEYRPASAPPHSPQWGDGDELGVTVAEYVDEDELYPYRPKERLRQDITILSMVASYQKPDGERVVVVTRWSMFRFRHSQFIQLPPAIAERVFGGIAVVGQAMLSAVRHAI